jgi:hypothetical protein
MLHVINIIQVAQTQSEMLHVINIIHVAQTQSDMLHVINIIHVAQTKFYKMCGCVMIENAKMATIAWQFNIEL